MYQCSHCRKTFDTERRTCPHCGVKFGETKHTQTLLPTLEREAAERKRRERFERFRRNTIRGLLIGGAAIISFYVAYLGVSQSSRQAQVFAAAASGNSSQLRELLGHGGGLNATLRETLRFKPAVNARGDDNATALLTSVRLGHANAVQALLDLGADPNATDKDGHTPLTIAEAYRYLDVASLLRRSRRSSEPTAEAEVSIDAIRSMTSRVLECGTGEPDVYLSPAIPAEVLTKATERYAAIRAGEDALALFDKSSGPWAIRGLLLTTRAVYQRDKYDQDKQIDLIRLREIELVPGFISETLRVNQVEFATFVSGSTTIRCVVAALAREFTLSGAR